METAVIISTARTPIGRAFKGAYADAHGAELAGHVIAHAAAAQAAGRFDAALRPVRGDGFTITAGNASQLSDGASACVVTSASAARRRGLIDLWELNEAFAVQVVYCADRLGLPYDRLNVNGGAIAIGHPYGMTMCVGGGQGVAALFEVA